MPFPIGNRCAVPCPVLTVASWPGYRFLKRQFRRPGLPISFKISHPVVASCPCSQRVWANSAPGRRRESTPKPPSSLLFSWPQRKCDTLCSPHTCHGCDSFCPVACPLGGWRCTAVLWSLSVSIRVFPCNQPGDHCTELNYFLIKKKIFPRFIVINTVKGCGIVNKAEIDAFLELSCFFHDPVDVDSLIPGSSAFSKTSLNIWKFTVHILLKLGLENFEHYFISMCRLFSYVVRRGYLLSPVHSLGKTLLAFALLH